MRTFDWALFELYNEHKISYEEAIRNADSANELRLNIKLKSKRGEPAAKAAMDLSYDAGPSEAELEEMRRQELERQALKRKQLEEEQLAGLRREKRRIEEVIDEPALTLAAPAALKLEVA
jgi:twitching motility protein PilU